MADGHKHKHAGSQCVTNGLHPIRGLGGCACIEGHADGHADGAHDGEAKGVEGERIDVAVAVLEEKSGSESESLKQLQSGGREMGDKGTRG